MNFIKRISRREFFKKMLQASALLFSLDKLPFAFSPLSFAENLKSEKAKTKLVVVTGGSAKVRLEAIFDALGGLKQVIPAKAKVVIKPNASFSRTPPQAVNTDPEMVYYLVKNCLLAEAEEVVAFDYPSDPAEISFKMSGIEEGVQKGGGKIYAADNVKYYKKASLPKAQKLKEQLINKDVLDNNFFINMPIPKQHYITELTMAMKNLMGVVWDRASYHTTDLHQSIAELATVVKPQLNIMDASRILLSNGPHGPGKVKKLNMTVACQDIVLIDAYGATLFGKKAEDIPYLKYAYQLGAGEIDLNKADMVNIKI